MERYIGMKIVLADPLDEFAFLASTGRLRPFGAENRLGYLVVYEDGYRSWSPKETFERAYRRVTDAEINLIENHTLAGLPPRPALHQERP